MRNENRVPFSINFHHALRGFGNLAGVMFAEAQQFTVRADYPHALITVSQRFLTSVLVLEPRAFLDAVKKLTADAPLGQSPAEAVMAWFVLKDAVVRGAECHHAWFHRRLDHARCLFHPCPLNAAMTFAPLHVISVLNDWAIEYAWGFDAVHSWPPASERGNSCAESQISRGASRISPGPCT